MSPASRSKSKDKKGGKEPPKAASKPSSVNAGATTPTSGYNPLLGTFHTIETAPVTSNAALHVNGRFRNIDETDDPSGHSLGPSSEYDSVSLNGSWSGESEDHKEKISNPPPRAETVVPGSDNDKREKIRQKNEKKHQRQKERRAQELHEKCSGYLMSRKLEALAQQLVAMGFSSERATMALILNEGRVEESVSWLFEGGEEADKLKEHNLDGGGNLKIDISEELARITDMENKYKCSKQEVERALVACEGDLEKAEETLRSQKQEAHSASSKPEESGDPPTLGNGKLPTATTQNLLRAPVKPSPNMILPKRDDRDFNYTKVAATSGSSAENGSKSIQSLKRVQPKLEWAKPPQMAAPAEKRWQNAGSNPSVSYSLASPLQASTLSSKTEARYITVGNELKNLQLGTVREPVIVMQRPNQSFNPKQIPASTVSSSPPGSTAGWVPYTVESVKANGLMPHIPGTRSLSPNGVSTNQLYSQLQYQQHQQPQQFVSSSGPVELPGTSRGNNLWSRTGALQTQTLSAASSLGLFSGLGTSGLSGSSSPVDWNSGGGSMEQLDYTNIDWSLDRGSSSSRAGGMWPGMNPLMQNNVRTYDSFTPGVGVTSAMRPALSNVGGGGVSIPGLQERASTAEASSGGSREWASPFEERDLFSAPRQFVSSPSL